MRKAFFLLTLLAIFSSLPICAYAHPGNTDGRGGHTDRSTGDYHYHHGYGAHQHKDMDGDGDLDCPYDFKTKQFSASSSENAANSIPEWIIYLSVFELILLVWFIYAYTDRGKYIEKLNETHELNIKKLKADFVKENKAIHQGIENLQMINEKIAASQAVLDSVKQQTVEERQALDKIFIEIEKAHTDRERIRKAPIDVSFAKDGYPIYWEYSANKPYGDFTVYHNRKGQIFHTDRLCAPYFAVETHLFRVLNCSRPCKKCASKYENYKIPKWFVEPN